MNAIYIGAGVLLLLWLSFNLHRKRKNRNKIICVVAGNCTGCRRCIKRCRRHVLEVVDDEAGKRAVVKNPDKCTACGDCLGICKFNALKLVERG